MLKSAMLCASMAIFHEARSEPVTAQIAVAKVLQHRAIRNATSVCKELARADQFSFYKRYHVVPKPINYADKCAWAQAKNIAKELYAFQLMGITEQHLYFNDVKMGKRYKTKTKPVTYGKLIFY